jgi:hypothetical protein
MKKTTTTKQAPNLLNVYIDNQTETIANYSPGPCVVEFKVKKIMGEYQVSLRFVCSDFSFYLTHQNWSPFKSIELLTLRLKEQMLQKFYERYAYA